jgi:predicted peptidase
MNRTICALTVLAVCLAALRPAAALTQKATFEKKVFRGAKGEKFPYRLLTPEGYDPKQLYPLVVYLHGAGSRGSDNERQLAGPVREFASPENRKKHPGFILAPQCPADTHWAAFIRHGTVDALLADLPKKYSIDVKRVYVIGQSDGGWGVWQLLALNPKRYAAAIPICGWGDPADAAKMAKVPIWVFHGAKDNVEPVKSSRDMVAALTKAGGTPRYTEYKDAGHAIWDRVYTDGKVLDWLFDQKRK